jgi:hypothetical protein
MLPSKGLPIPCDRESLNRALGLIIFNERLYLVSIQISEGLIGSTNRFHVGKPIFPNHVLLDFEAVIA